MNKKGFVFFSNSLEVLFEHLKESLFSEEDGAFFQRLVVVPSMAMRQWIQLQFANSLSIACGIRFIFLDQAMKLLMGQFFNSPTPYFLPNRYELTIRIKNEIDGLLQSSDPIWQPLILYVNGGEKRSIALANHLSMLFERYGIYGGAAIERWENRPSNWQEALWARIFSSQDENHKPWDYPQRVFNSLETVEAPFQGSLHLFSFSHISPLYFQFLRRLATRVPTTFYQFSPCQEFWSDLSNEGPTLLSPLGKVGRQMAKQIEEAAELECEQTYLVFGGDSQLKRLQRDILLLQSTDCIVDDDSIEIHIATTAHQEICHLHEELIKYLASGKLEPKDIVVMAPSIMPYVPYIKAIFSDIPYQIHDLPSQKNQPFLEALFLMLDLEKKRWSASAVLELLSRPLFYKKNELSDEDREQIRKWVETTGMSWGVDEKHRDHLLKKRHCCNGLLDGLGSWMDGLESLIEELALPRFDDHRPFRIHFSEAELLGHFITLLKSMHLKLKGLEEEKTLMEWALFLKEMATEYLLLEEGSSLFFLFLEKLIKASPLFPKEKFRFDFIYEFLQEISTNESDTINKNLLQSIRFCSMLPMRAIPVKVICIIGMHHANFPGKEKLQEYDLLHLDPHSKTAPSRTDFDRYLFLEAILSARQKLWISYQGYDLHELTEMPPSSVVSELLSFITARRTNAAKSQPFLQKKIPFSIKINPTYELPKGHFVVNIADLLRQSRSCLHHFLFFHDLKIEDELSLNSEEPFVLSPLQRAIVRREGIQNCPEVVIEKIKKRGHFPLGLFGSLAEWQVEEEIENLPKSFIAPLTIKPCTFNVNSSLSVTFMGTFHHLLQDGLFTMDRCTVKGAVKAWPHLLLLNSLDSEKNKLFFSQTDAPKALFFDRPDSYIKTYLEYFFYTRDNPFPMVADWIEPILKKESKKMAQIAFYDPTLKWYCLGKGEIDYERLIDHSYPFISKVYQEMVDAWF